jgi:hypothetical protein
MMKKLFHYIISFLIAFSLLMAGASSGQVKVQVVSQTISRKIGFTEGMSVMLNAEHAEIFFTSHPENTIDIELIIISKHEDRTMAETDLNKMKWLIENKGNVCYIRNYIELTRNETKPESSIKVIYHIKIPEKCPINIRNYFGKIDIRSLNNPLKIDGEFSAVDLQGSTGTTDISTSFGDITASGIQGETTITSSRANIFISESGGVIKLDASFGAVCLQDLKSVISIRIEAKKSTVNFNESNPDQYSYRFDFVQSKIIKPEKMILNSLPNEKDMIRAAYNQGRPFPTVYFDLDNSTLTIQQ